MQSGRKRRNVSHNPTVNILSDAEWLDLVNVVCAVELSNTHEDLRYQAVKALRKLIPFQTAAFFLSDPVRCNLDGCLIAQPVGEDVPAVEFERYLNTVFRSDLLVEDATGKVVEGGFESRREDAGEDAGGAAGVVSSAADEGASGASFSETTAGEQGVRRRCSYVFRGRNDAASRKGADAFLGSHCLDDYFMLTCNMEGESGPLGSLCLGRTPEQGSFSERDQFVLEVLEPHLTQKLSLMYSGGNYGMLREDALREECHLSKREIDVVRCVVYGMTTPEIATKLVISSSTTKKHLENIYRKTGVNNRMSLMKFAQQFMGAQ